MAGAAALVLVATAWFAYQRGQLSAGFDAAAVNADRERLQAEVDRLTAQNSTLTAKVAELEASRRMDREAYSEVERTLGELQSQLSRQGDDLAFYRSIVSPADGIQGLRIQSFEVDQGAAARDFVLKLTLIQAMRHDSNASGMANVVIHGMQGDRPTRYSVGELLGKPRAQLPFSFRYFQVLEQDVTLPEGFQAFEAEVQVRSSKLRFPMQQSFPWKIGEPTTL